VVVELTRINRRLTYLDAYKGMTKLMRPTLVFYNHFLENESLTAIVILPYTPIMLDYLSPLQIYSLNRALDMRTNYENIPNVMDIYKQKLIDLFYCVDDT